MSDFNWQIAVLVVIKCHAHLQTWHAYADRLAIISHPDVLINLLADADDQRSVIDHSKSSSENNATFGLPAESITPRYIPVLFIGKASV